MKKILSVVLCFCFLCIISSCTEKTEYDDKTVVRIETTWADGMGYGFIYKRIFDFTDSKVYDITLADERIVDLLKNQYENDPEYYKGYVSLEEYEEYLYSCYNHLNEITTFTEEDAQGFLKEVKSLGIYTWGENYETDEIICDGSGSDINIIFTDGTEKNTYTYFKYPKNYKRVLNAFKKHFNVGCWLGN